MRIGATRGVVMKTRIIPATDVLAAHEQAALEIGELRRKGIPCHLEDRADRSGHHVDVVCESASRARGEKRHAERGGNFS
jgi:hypothetical protein